MRRLGGTIELGTARGERARRTARGTMSRRVTRGSAAALLAAAMLTGATGFAAAQEPAAPATPAPVSPVSPAAPAPAPVAATTQVILTTLPNAWQSRLDLKPVLEVLSDGTAVKRADGGPQEVTGTVPSAVLATAAADIRALAAADMGTPSVTDQGAMILDFMPAPPDQEVHLIVYAPEFTEGLTDEQLAARAKFAELYNRLLTAFIPA
ncbi:hypothetical protein [Nocardia huaxiensis]|uniref:Uncharacterized protein n=1 Tax=Nocardia huaxiensis TaxID=2755382 RepID=A0A7D6VFS1_9NOCA|nr:hypothetical protein [Nocardia huaxiensis]QLY29096.1 hypothetical protein H0264_27870 [Nocardia huaxiensis]UFS97415.1 hypothetical protein LPY97_05730 [Nocardia huaxiensis]